MSKKLYVWDPLIRIFHAALIIAFTISYFTGEGDSIWHIYTGYIIIGLLIFRLILGFTGSQYARFSSFIFSPAKVLSYLGSLFSKKCHKEEQYIGHNPAGSWMVVMLLITLSLTTLSGLISYGKEGNGPLGQLLTEINIQIISSANAHGNKPHSKNDDKKDNVDDDNKEEHDEFWGDIHEFFVNLTILLILLHISGVVLSNRKHGHKLIQAMITGYKIID
ncbi:MAG: cytochrome b/b6 domain-containing protein [Gammaproteobacteria bacterium]|nr:cytochrome b/b6 domain-containing protein [Gammaproteobacteria bacterium]